MVLRVLVQFESVLIHTVALARCPGLQTIPETALTVSSTELKRVDAAPKRRRE
jgi:hypothetical protein